VSRIFAIAFAAFLAFFSIRHFAAQQEEQSTTAELRGFTGAAVSYGTSHGAGVSPLSGCCNRPEDAFYRGVTFAARTSLIRQLGKRPMTRLIVNLISPAEPRGFQWRRPRGTHYSFWMPAREPFNADTLHEGRLPQSALQVTSSAFDNDSVGLATWGPINVVDYGPRPVAAWLPVARSVLSLQHFRPRGHGVTPYFYLQEAIEARPVRFLQRPDRGGYPGMEVGADDVVIWSEPFRNRDWSRIDAIVMREPRHFVRLTFAQSSESAGNGTFYTDLRDLGAPGAVTFELLTWRNAAAEAEYAAFRQRERGRALPPLSGCDVYGPVQQMWFSAAKGFIAGPDDRADLRSASAVKLAATTVRAKPRAPLLSLDYERSARASIATGGDTDVLIDEGLRVAGTRRTLVHTPMRNVVTIIVQSLLAAFAVAALALTAPRVFAAAPPRPPST
jgi:hypothetical protein